MLEIKNASITIGGRQLFAGLSFTVPDGQTVCLTGSSGSGKTTLLRAILGFHPLDEGHISIDGELLTPSSPRSSASTYHIYLKNSPCPLSG